MTDPLGQSQVIPYIKGLSGYGYKFTLLSCEKKERLEEFRNQIEKTLEGSSIEWVPIIYHKYPPVVSTIYDYLKLKSKAIELYKSKKFILIHCRSYISSLIGLYFKEKYNIPFVFDMRGFWADERVDGGLWNLKNPIYKAVYKFFKRKEYDFLSNCSVAVSLTKAGKEEMKNWKACVEHNTIIHIIPCSADFDLFKLSEDHYKKEKRRVLGIDEKDFVVSYLGSLGTWYMLDEMLDFFKVLSTKYANAKFLIITPDNPLMVFESAKRKDIDTDKFIIEFAQRSEVAEKLSVSDLSIFFIKPMYSKLSSSPTKLGELLAMGVPVICNDRVGDVDEIVSALQAGYVLKKFNTEEYAKAVNEIPELLKKDPKHIREKASDYYSLNNAIEKYARIYAQII